MQEIADMTDIFDRPLRDLRVEQSHKNPSLPVNRITGESKNARVNEMARRYAEGIYIWEPGLPPLFQNDEVDEACGECEDD